MRRLLMGRLIRIFTVCLVPLFFYYKNLKNETNKVVVQIYLMFEVTWLYPNDCSCQTTSRELTSVDDSTDIVMFCLL